jgi:AraC-like DNA-binding protein
LVSPSPDPLTEALAHKARAGAPGVTDARPLAVGDGWRVYDVVCTAGPRDRPFGERHQMVSISIVLSGLFTYRSDGGAALLSPGAVLLGNAGQGYECAHVHGEGDRCLSFHFAPERFARIAHDAGVARAVFTRARLAPSRALAPLVARAISSGDEAAALEELALDWAGAAVAVAGSGSEAPSPPPGDRRRIAGALRRMESALDGAHPLAALASEAELSPFHFLRMFRRVTGVTPHQWLLRARLREAARQLRCSDAPITEIALAVGFADLSNFIRSFRAELGSSPRAYRRRG